MSVWAIGEHTVVSYNSVFGGFNTQNDIMETHHSFCSMVSFLLIELLQPLEYIGAITGAKYLKGSTSNLAVGTSLLSLLSVLPRLGLVRS